MTGSADRSSPAESLFADYLARLQAGEDLEFEELCREHPAAELDLRRLWAAYDSLHSRLLEARPGSEDVPRASLLERLQEEIGAVLDPGQSIQGRGPGDDAFAREAVSRLGRRSEGFDRYTILDEIGRGGMGSVLRVWDGDLRRWLAMKLVRARRTGGPAPADAVGTRTLGRFLEEAHVTGQLDHPGIVPVHELGLDSEGRVYFTMKLVEGRTLQAVFDEAAKGEGGWTRTRVLGLLLKVCEAMAYAHSKGVIHRDLKPANVMVGRFGEVYVMDWGLARVLGREDSKDIRLRPPEPQPSVSAGPVHESPLLTMDGDVIGTPAFMPPEQARGEVERLDERADVYSLGAMLYQLLTGSVPYVADPGRATWMDLLERVRAGPPPPIETLAPATPKELVAICAKAMSRSPEQRYASVSALSGDLEAFVEGRVVSAYESGAWAAARKWVRRNRLLAGTATAAGIALLVLGTVAAKSYGRLASAAARADAAAREGDLAGVIGALDSMPLWVARRLCAEEGLEQALELGGARDPRSPLACVAPALANDDLETALMEAAARLARQDQEGTELLHRFLLRYVAAGARPATGERVSTSLWALRAAARLLYESPLDGRAGAGAYERLRNALVLHVRSASLPLQERLLAFTALSGCGLPADALVLVERAASPLAEEEEQRLALRCAGRILWRARGSPVVPELDGEALGATLAELTRRTFLRADGEVEGAHFENHRLASAALDRLVKLVCALELTRGCRAPLAGVLDSFVPGWMDDMGDRQGAVLMFRAATDPEVVAGEILEFVASPPSATGLRLPVFLGTACSMIGDDELTARVRAFWRAQDGGSNGAAVARFESGLSWSEVGLESEWASHLDADTLFGSRPTEAALTDLPFVRAPAGPDAPGTVAALTWVESKGPPVTAGAVVALRGRAVDQPATFSGGPGPFLRMSQPGLSELRIRLGPLEAGPQELLRLELVQLAAYRGYYPYGGEAVIEVSFGQQLVGSARVLEAHTHVQTMTLPTMVLGRDNRELTLRCAMGTSTTYRLYSVRLLRGE